MKGKLTISKQTNLLTSENLISIQLYDSENRKHLLIIETSLENFADTITGLGRVDCDFIIKEQK